MALKKVCKNISGRTIVLLILDGFGVSKRKNGNAILAAKMPNYRSLLKQYPNSLLKADAEAVGLPAGMVGNSEAGHTTIGAGRPVPSDKVKVNRTIKSGEFMKNPALLKAIEHVKKHGTVLHLMGLLTNSQSAHADFSHIKALVKLAKAHKVKTNIHVFTDGRDTSPYHALKLLSDLEKDMGSLMRIGTVAGRFYAMDRDRHWQRTALVYHAMAHGEGLRSRSAAEAIEEAYERGESDEFIIPSVIGGESTVKSCNVCDNSAVIFWNLRSDRARQLIKPFIEKNFEKDEKGAFQRHKRIKNTVFVTLTEFGKRIDHAIAAYPHHEISGTLVEALRSYEQKYIAESEKYAHVTYFLNGGYDQPRFSESRERISSQNVMFSDQKPQMRAKEIAKSVGMAVKNGYDFVCANLANPDMVAHTGNFKATVQACEAVDDAIGAIWKEVKKHNGVLFVTGDHGNAEEVSDLKGEYDTQHNANPVPFIAAGDCLPCKRLKNGTLADVAPTILNTMQIKAPPEMTGNNLFY